MREEGFDYQRLYERVSRQNTLTGLVIIFLLIGLFFYSLDRNIPLKGILIDDKAAVPTQAEVAPYQPPIFKHVPYTPPQITFESVDPLERMIFVRKLNEDREVWLMKPTFESEQYDIPQVAAALKYPKSGKVFYQQAGSGDKFYVRDINTQAVQEFKPLTYPRESVETQVDIQGIQNLAPDESHIVFVAYFSEPCPGSDDPNLTSAERVSNDGGLCTPEDDLMKEGYYLYSFETGESTFLAGNVQIARWDVANKKLYYVNQYFTAPKAIMYDYGTGVSSDYVSGDTFGFMMYPLLGAKQRIQFDGSTGDAAAAGPSLSQITFVDTYGEEQVLDHGKWADIQPFVVFAPDESSFMYMRTEHISGIQKGSLYLVDLTAPTLQPTRITPESKNISYTHNGMWLSNDVYIALARDISLMNRPGFLVSINIKTGEVKELTKQMGLPERDVYSFGNL
jgi:hypothetical protein